MSTKRKPNTKNKTKSKSRKVEYDEEDISSEHESDVEEHHQENADGDDAIEEDSADLTNIPELPAPEVRSNFLLNT